VAVQEASARMRAGFEEFAADLAFEDNYED
jgi:hypothetical protein